MSSKPIAGTFYDLSVVGKRDAMHVPYVIVQADTLMEAGQSVKFVVGTGKVFKCHKQMRQAIVDPFLPRSAKPGEGFCVFLEPALVGDLVHYFSIDGLDNQSSIKTTPNYNEVAELLEKLEEKENELARVKRELRNVEDELENDSCRGCY